ncbi:hypothetical protein F5883DRAFT_222491 [Diaporthe sp. PMI_573]|nr:hypothetical protein F5883DRAFT_222491 [Diaporthaceae sp. PMI_573]
MQGFMGVPLLCFDLVGRAGSHRCEVTGSHVCHYTVCSTARTRHACCTQPLTVNISSGPCSLVASKLPPLGLPPQAVCR